ncbi:hypothetical protein [Streptococcus anginosus]|nr:hypothetical protein [Streptococcus anginosus]
MRRRELDAVSFRRPRRSVATLADAGGNHPPQRALAQVGVALFEVR